MKNEEWRMKNGHKPLSAIWPVARVSFYILHSAFFIDRDHP
jgi:hypothetical protein